jgi:hypothetical protein
MALSWLLYIILALVRPVLELSKFLVNRLNRLRIWLQIEAYLYGAGLWTGVYNLGDDNDRSSSERAIAWIERAAELNDNQESTHIAQYFADVHFSRMSRLGLKPDADKLEQHLHTILSESCSNHRAVFMLCDIYRLRYRRTLSYYHIEQALDLTERVILTSDDNDPELPLLLGCCAVALFDQSEALNSRDSLDMAILLFETGKIMLGNRRRSFSWSFLRANHAEALIRQFEASGDQACLDDALQLMNEVGNLSRFQLPIMLRYGLIRLRALDSQWQLRPRMDTLMSLRRELAAYLKYLPKNASSPMRPEIFQFAGVNTSRTWTMPDGRTGDGFAMVQDGLEVARTQLRSWSQPESDNPPGLAPFLQELAVALDIRHEAYFSPVNLDLSCNTMTLSVRLTDSKSMHLKGRAARMLDICHKMAGLAVERFAITLRTVETVMLPILVLGRAPIILRSQALIAKQLGLCALDRYEQNEEMLFLDRAISHFGKAVELAITDTLQLVELLRSLSRAHLKRGEAKAKVFLEQRQGIAVPDALNESHVATRGAILTDFDIAVTQLDRIKAMGTEIGFTNMDSFETLGKIYQARFSVSREVSDAQQAIEAWTNACASRSVTPLYRWTCAVSICGLQREIMPLIGGDLMTLADSLRTAVNVTLELITDGDTHKELIWKVRILSRLASYAASVGILAGKPPEEMLKLLEQGRTLIWSRSLNRRVDVSALLERHRDIAEKFIALQLQLVVEKASNRQWGSMTYSEMVQSNRHHLREEQQRLLQQIRSQPGFEDFMHVPIHDQALNKHASQGPVVVFVQGKECYAIVITTSTLESVHLPEFGLHECEQHLGEYQKFLQSCNQDMNEANRCIDSLLIWFWRAAAEPVLSHIYQVLDLDIKQPPQTLPRVWWVTSGFLNVFPIHAASDHRRAVASGEPCSVMDLVTSSYTPTLQVLEYTRRTMDRMTSKPSIEPSAVLVGMKFTPNKSPDLDNAIPETQAVSSILSSAGFTVMTLGNPSSQFQASATRKAVVLGLRKSTVAVFAAHGEAAADPINSKIYLQDWDRRPFNVGMLMNMDFENLQLVELSACQMAVSRDPFLMEEGLHMSGAFQMAGVPNTIATWWPVLDMHATRISETFHRGLITSGQSSAPFLDVRLSALSLRKTLIQMRNEGLSPVIWGAYVHFGV